MLSDEDKKIRQGRITGTRIAKILNRSPFGGPIDAYMEITGETAEKTSEVLNWGNELEGPILKKYEETTGCSVSETAAIVHPKHNMFSATPDGIIPDKKVIEVKAVFNKSHEWGSDEGDTVPVHYLLQVAWEMACADLNEADVVALIHGQLRVYSIKRDRELEDFLLSRALDFYDKHIKTNIAPTDYESGGYSDYLAKRFPEHTNNSIEASPETDSIFKQLMVTKRLISMAEEKKREAENRLKDIIKDNAGIRGPEYSITWKQVKGRAGWDMELIQKDLGLSDKDMQRYRKPGLPYRRFYPKEKKGLMKL